MQERWREATEKERRKEREGERESEDGERREKWSE